MFDFRVHSYIYLTEHLRNRYVSPGRRDAEFHTLTILPVSPQHRQTDHHRGSAVAPGLSAHLLQETHTVRELRLQLREGGEERGRGEGRGEGVRGEGKGRGERG